MAKVGRGSGSSPLSIPNLDFLYYLSNQSATGKPDPEKDRKKPHKDCLKTRDGNCVD
jgi:hypothetical protein